MASVLKKNNKTKQKEPPVLPEGFTFSSVFYNLFFFCCPFFSLDRHQHETQRRFGIKKSIEVRS